MLLMGSLKGHTLLNFYYISNKKVISIRRTSIPVYSHGSNAIRIIEAATRAFPRLLLGRYIICYRVGGTLIELHCYDESFNFSVDGYNPPVDLFIFASRDQVLLQVSEISGFSKPNTAINPSAFQSSARQALDRARKQQPF